MNAIRPDDEMLPAVVGLRDVWDLEVDWDAEEGHTWGYQPPGRFPPTRLDKVLFLGELRFADHKIEGGNVRKLRRIGVGLEYTPPMGEQSVRKGGRNWVSDHYGLWAKVGIEECVPVACGVSREDNVD